MNPAAYMLSAASAGPFKDTIILGHEFPSEIGGQPVKYLWKEALPLGKYRDAAGKEFSVDAARIENLIVNFKKAKANGFQPFLPPDHKTRRGDKNFGFVVDATVNERGSLNLLHQVIGDDAIKAVARNKTSICTVSDVTDEHGNTYSELIDHNAIIPDPQLNNLESFQPAIAASRGSVPATVLQLAAPRSEPMIDLKKLRTTLAAADSLSDEAVIALAETKIGESAATATKLTVAENDLKLSRDALKTAKEKADASDAKVLELSRNAPKPPDEDTLMLMSDSFNTEREAALAGGGISPDTAKELQKLLESDGKPNTLALSRLPGSPQPMAKRIWQILRNNKPVPIGEKTKFQTLSRQNPNDDSELDETKLAAAGREQGAAYAKQNAPAK